MTQPLQILLLSSHLDDPIQVRRALQPHFSDLHVRQVTDAAQFEQALSKPACNLALIEARPVWSDCFTLLQALQIHWPTCSVILIVSEDTFEIVRPAIRAGVEGYVSRVSQQLSCLPTAVWLALERASGRKTIEETYARYRKLFDTVPVGVYRTTPEGQILEVNQSFIEMLGYPDRETLLAINVVRLYVNPQAREQWQSMLQQNASRHFFETQFYRFDGTPIWVEHTLHILRDDQGGLLYYQGILQNITERKKAELALQESEERFRTIVEQSPLSIQVMTPEGWTIQVNRAWEKLWGVTAADVKQYNMLQDEQAISLGMMPYVQRGFAGETVLMPPVAYDTSESVRTGRKHWFQARIYPILGEQDRPRNIIMMYEDITERQWATEDLQKLSMALMNAQEAERKRISQELHDELGQALTAVRINLDILEKELAPNLTSVTHERLAEVRMLADETLEHVRELSHTLRPTMLDELGLTPTLRWYVSRCAERLGIQIDLEANDDADRLAAELETIVYRIVQEALTNIARHARARQVHVQLVQPESKVAILIEDDGQGFDVQRKLATEPLRGMGLLSMRERVLLWGGTFNIQSGPGRGTRLSVELPIRPRQAPGEI